MKRKTNKSERNIKKMLICSMLIVIAVFVFFERDKFLEPVYYESQISTGKFEDILLINNDSYAYQYRTGEIEPTQLMLKFENMNRFETQGVINLCVYDQKNELVADSEVTAASLKSREDWANFQLSKPLEANQKYKIVVSAQNVKNAQGVYLVVDKGLQEAVTKEMAFTRAFLYNGCFLLLLGAFIFACIPWSKVEGYLSEDADRDVNLMLILSRSLLIITPVLCFIIVESMSGGLIFILNMDNTKII